MSCATPQYTHPAYSAHRVVRSLFSTAANTFLFFLQVLAALIPDADRGKLAAVEALDDAVVLMSAAHEHMVEFDEWCLKQSTAVGVAPLWAACEGCTARSVAWLLASSPLDTGRPGSLPARGRSALALNVVSALLAAAGAYPGVWIVQDFVAAALCALVSQRPAFFAEAITFDVASGIEFLSAASHTGGGSHSAERRRLALWTLRSLHRALGDDVWRRHVIPRLVAAGHAEATATALCSLLRPGALRINRQTMIGRCDGSSGTTALDGGGDESFENWSGVRSLVVALADVLTLGGETLLVARFSEHCRDRRPGVLASTIHAICAETHFWTAATAAAVDTSLDQVISPGAFMLSALDLLMCVWPNESRQGDSDITLKAAVDFHHSGGVAALFASVEAMMGMEVGVAELDAIANAVTHIKNILLIPFSPLLMQNEATLSLVPDLILMAAVRRTALNLACLWRPVIVASHVTADVTSSLETVRREACHALASLQERIGPLAVNCIPWRIADDPESSSAIVAACYAFVSAAAAVVGRPGRAGPCCDDQLDKLPMDAALQLVLLLLLRADNVIASPADTKTAVTAGVPWAVSKVRWTDSARLRVGQSTTSFQSWPELPWSR